MSVSELNRQQLISLVQALKPHVDAEVFAEELRKHSVGKKKRGNTPAQSQAKKAKIQKKFEFSKYNARKIAIHLMYIGDQFGGFAAQVSLDTTIENHLFNALIKTCLIEARDSSDYSRCGRTDKGVSAFGQVVALHVRSRSRAGESLPPWSDELDYAHMLNRCLPAEIRVLGWNDVSPTFSARFNASYRTYRYFFPKRGLDLDAMRDGCQRYVGRHDFRNFCKIDVMNVQNFEREIFNFDIFTSDGERYIGSSAAATSAAKPSPTSQGDTAVMVAGNWSNRDMMYFELRGQAFLWHQVRCMVAVLFLIGRRLEPPSIVDTLLDVTATPGKPAYRMAPDGPLVLYDCGFDPAEFTCRYSNTALQRVHTALETLWSDAAIRAARLADAIRMIEAVQLDSAEGPTLGEFIRAAHPDSIPDGGVYRVEYPWQGSYQPLLSLPCADPLSTRLDNLTSHKHKKRREKHPNFYQTPAKPHPADAARQQRAENAEAARNGGGGDDSRE